ncbi:hypothetical protein LCGC14_2769840, partial [marine sediment metagenome]
KQITIIYILRAFITETLQLANMQKAKTDGDFCRALEQMNQKWRAFVRILSVDPTYDGAVREDGFIRHIEQSDPNMYRLWQTYQKGKVVGMTTNEKKEQPN